MSAAKQSTIRQKLIRIIVATTAIALLSVSAFILLIDFLMLRRTTAQGLSVLADAVAYNSSAALAFEDPVDAARVLEAFQADRYIREAVLLDNDGVILAEYGQNRTYPFPPIPEETAVFEEGMIYYAAPVMEGDARLGTLLIRYDQTALQGRLVVYLFFVVAMVSAALLVAYLLAAVLQKRISVPILALEKLARRISEKHDYSIRAERLTNDEIGTLTDSFNEMLEQIAEKESALRVSSERLRIAVEASRMGVWDTNLKTGEVEWVGSIYKSLGLENKPRGTEAEEHFFNIVHSEDREVLKQKLETAKEVGSSRIAADFRVTDREGNTRHLRTRGQTYFDDAGQPIRMVGVFIDVTDLRAAEAEIRDLNRNLEERVKDRTGELQQALHEIEAFSYSVSHDLRAPLRSINGFSQALLDDYNDRLDDEGRDFLRRIVSSCQRMGQLIDDLLELSRVTRHEISREPVDLGAIAREAATALQASEPDRKVEFIIADDLMVEGDSNLLAIALDNLIRNAWKFSSKAENARIEIGKEIHDGKQAFFVRDNGAGFDMNFADKLFGVFQRLHPIGEFEGTGIGLATVRRIVERHGGTAWAEGELDKGATFYFTLKPLRTHN